MENCTEFNTTLVDTIDVDSSDDTIKICTVIDSAGCTITFRYNYLDEQRVTVEALKKKVSCPEPVDILGILFYTILHFI